MDKNYEEFELNEAYEQVIREYKSRYKKSKNPKVILIGGQPGAGKSGMLRILNKNNDFIFINGDEYRELHPRYKELEKEFGEDASKYTNQWASALVRKLLDELYTEKYNLIIEGTLRTLEVPKNQAEISKKCAYEVELCVLAVKPEISYLSVQRRYEKMLANGQVTRMSPREVQEEAANNIYNNLDELYKLNLFDNIRLFDRNDKEIYNMKKSENLNPADVLKNEFTREWTEKEIKNYISSYTELIEILKNRKAPIEKIEEAEKEKNRFLYKGEIKIDFPAKYDLTLESEVLREFIWEIKAEIYRLKKMKKDKADLDKINEKTLDYIVNLANLDYEKVLQVKEECINMKKSLLH